MPPLKRIRNEKGMTRKELASLTGVSASTIILLENGTTYDPKVYTVQRLADALGVRFDELYESGYVEARYVALGKN